MRQGSIFISKYIPLLDSILIPYYRMNNTKLFKKAKFEPQSLYCSKPDFKNDAIVTKKRPTSVPACSEEYITFEEEQNYMYNLMSQQNKTQYCEYSLMKIYHWLSIFHSIFLKEAIGEFVEDSQGNIFLFNVVIIDLEIEQRELKDYRNWDEHRMINREQEKLLMLQCEGEIDSKAKKWLYDLKSGFEVEMGEAKDGNLEGWKIDEIEQYKLKLVEDRKFVYPQREKHWLHFDHKQVLENKERDDNAKKLEAQKIEESIIQKKKLKFKKIQRRNILRIRKLQAGRRGEDLDSVLSRNSQSRRKWVPSLLRGATHHSSMNRSQYDQGQDLELLKSLDMREANQNRGRRNAWTIHKVNESMARNPHLRYVVSSSYEQTPLNQSLDTLKDHRTPSKRQNRGKRFSTVPYNIMKKFVERDNTKLNSVNSTAFGSNHMERVNSFNTIDREEEYPKNREILRNKFSKKKNKKMNKSAQKYALERVPFKVDTTTTKYSNFYKSQNTNILRKTRDWHKSRRGNSKTGVSRREATQLEKMRSTSYEKKTNDANAVRMKFKIAREGIRTENNWCWKPSNLDINRSVNKFGKLPKKLKETIYDFKRQLSIKEGGDFDHQDYEDGQY